MFVNISDDRVRVEILQRMLRYLSFAYGDDELGVSISGVFDPVTTSAVRHYQKTNSLPQTGVVDQTTWDSIVRDYDREASLRLPVYIYPIPTDPYHVTKLSERSDIVLILQVILGALRQIYDYPPVPLSGVYGQQTADAVRIYQGARGLPQTGEADRATWRHLAEEFNNLVSQ